MEDYQKPQNRQAEVSAVAWPPEGKVTVAQAVKLYPKKSMASIRSLIARGKLRRYVVPPPPVNKNRGRRPSVFIDLQDLEALIEPVTGTGAAS